MCRRRRIRESVGRGDGLGLLPLDLAVAGASTAVARAESEPELALAVNGMASRAASDCIVAMGVIFRTSWAPAYLIVAAHADLLIAATALEWGLSVVTVNLRHEWLDY